MPLPGYDARGPSRGGSSSSRMLKLSPWQRPSSAPAPPRGTLDRALAGAALPGRETGPKGAQPPPQGLELSASKAADFSRL